MSAADATRWRVALPCTGLGRQRRGFERFTRELAAVLLGAPGLDLRVFGGGDDPAAGETPVWNLPRDSRAARAIGRVAGWDPYFVEQGSFFSAFVPHLLTWRPHLVYFADLNLGNACWHWRRLTGQRFHLLFYNGGATTRPYTRCDWVQQLTHEHYDAALGRGEAAARMLVLAHGVHAAARPAPRDAARVAATRRALGVPDGRALLLSVGMLDASVKRMDALIEATAALATPRPFLALLGQDTAETPRLRALAAERLGSGCWMGTWPADRMAEAYEAADAFALFSPREGFGLAYVEALRAGLPCAVHDTPGTREIFGDLGCLGDTRYAAQATALLQRALQSPADAKAREARHARVQSRFSWDVLAPRYAEMLRSCASGALPAWSAP